MFTAAGIILPAAQHAHALELFGTCLFGKCKNEAAGSSDLIDPKTYQITFQVSGSEELEDAITSKSELWRGRDSAVAGSAGLSSRAKGDYRRILAALYNEGYYAGSISIRVDGKQATDISLGEELPDRSTVEVTVEPGAPYRFSTARIVNAAPPALSRDDEVKSAFDLGFAEGEIAKATAIRAAAINAREAWRQQGHAKAKVESREATAEHATNQLECPDHNESGP